MSTTQETSVTSSEDWCTGVDELRKGTKTSGEAKADIEGSKSTVEELFPWITEFKKKCRRLLAQPNIVALIKLMKFYARNVSVNVNECYTKPYRAAKLKDSISETLVFFLFYFRELVEVCDKNSYLDKMSDLLAMYLDMELKASRRGKEHHTRIAARLTTCLYVYLENSSEHILDTFIKARFINRNYHDILEPVLTKISTTISARPNCDTMYVRYLLIYRLWKKVNNDAAVKNRINAAAILHLGPPPPNPTPFLAKYVLPKIPKSQANSTKFLLLHKFDIEKSCRLFIQYCKENREDEDQGDLDKPNFVANTSSSDTFETLGGVGTCRGMTHVDNLIDNVNILPEGERRQRTPVKTNYNNGESFPQKCGGQECIKAQINVAKIEAGEISPLKPISSSKVVPRLKTKKTGDILFIDLTADVITEKVIKKKKHRKLHWLTEIKKKLNSKTIKAAEKKKKTPTIPNNLSNDLTPSGLVDSTSSGSLSNATTPEPSNCSLTDPIIVKSFSTPTKPEPDNCVTSNFAETELPLPANSCSNQISDSVEKYPNCDVTTTVTESIPIAPNELEETIFNASDSVDISKETISPTTTFNDVSNQSPQYSCQTISKKSDVKADTELSNALSHLSEVYNSDNGALDTGFDEKVESVEKISEIDVIQSDSIPVEREVVLENMELDQDSVKPLSGGQRTSSESSDVAVIFTRRASDVEIVDLDDYPEDNGEICEPEKIKGGLHSSNDSKTDKKSKEFRGENFVQNSETLKVNDSLSELIINNDLKDLTLPLDRLKLTDTANVNNGQTEKVKDRKNGTLQKNCFNNSNMLKSEKMNETKSNPLTNNGRLVEAVNENKTLIDSQIRSNTLEKLEPSELIDSDIKKHCDYKSSKGERLGDIKLTPSDALEIAKKQRPGFVEKLGRTEIVEKEASSIQNEYIEERTSIPKINEILIRNKNVENNISNISNDLLTNQAPQFSENIDGLSLLASVSQHISHLEEYSEKSLSKPKIINGEVTRTNSGLKDVLETNRAIDEITTHDSYELALDLKADAGTEIINDSVGVSHPTKSDSVNESHLKSGNYKKCGSDVGKNDSLDVVPLILETTVDLNSSTLHNNLISVENVTQMIKESTNVIVNGETVVLFQKSPNSNLYIINKAVDGTMECLGEEKKSATKIIERSSTTMRDIINHIPINLCAKNMDRQDGGKTHRSKISVSSKNKTDGRKVEDNSTKKYENQLLSNHFKLIRDEFPKFNDKLQDEYIKKEIVSVDCYEESFVQRCTDTPGSVIELEPVKKSPPPIIRLTDTPVDVQMLTNQQQICCQESTAINMAKSGRLSGNIRSHKSGEKGEGTSNENLTYVRNIKQEFDSCANNLSNDLNSHSQEVVKQNYPNDLFPVNSIRSSNIPHVYSTVTTADNSYSVEHERCNYPSCSLKVSSSQSYQSISQSVPTCQLSHCGCIKFGYEVHCREFVQRPPAAHASYLQTNSYFISADSSAKPCTTQERELKLNEAALAKLHDDQLLHNIEQSIIDSKELNEANVKTVREIKYKPEFDSKLPLKKRLKAHAMLSMSYEESPIKIEKVENYPGTPMMSIAALEARNVSQPTSPLHEDKPTPPSSALELSPRGKDDSFSHHTTEMIRRDYLKDTPLTSIGNCGNVDDRVRKLEQQRRQTNSHVNIMGTGCQRSFKTPAQRKEVATSSPASLKRPATSAASYPKSPKKAKKAKITANGRQTRSSKRNIPKVDYSYDGIIDADPKFNALSELRRKRKKTNR